jgi:hypothetical protein
MAEKSVKPSSKGAASQSGFKVGDLPVYPAHGVGRIEAIETKVVNGEEHDFYIMKIIENGNGDHDSHVECRVGRIAGCDPKKRDPQNI